MGKSDTSLGHDLRAAVAHRQGAPDDRVRIAEGPSDGPPAIC
jgi:hypothetical protein